MIDIIITSYNEPNSTIRAVKAFLNQDFSDKYRIIVVDPFKETEDFIKKKIKSKKLHFFLDPGEGKSYALNLLFQEFGSSNKDDFFILTDGDVFVSDNAVSAILKKFQDKSVGCVTGRPIPIDLRETKYGYWASLLFEGIHNVRKKLSADGKFFECSGYLFAIRKGVILDFPLETSEDSIIPYLFWKKGYRISYAENARAYVKNPDNFKEWVIQKVRNIKAHENLNKIASDLPRTKSFFNEIKYGLFYIFTYPKSFKEFMWTIQLYFARLYIYYRAFKELKKNRGYKDGWRETEIKSTKTLD